MIREVFQNCTSYAPRRHLRMFAKMLERDGCRTSEWPRPSVHEHIIFSSSACNQKPLQFHVIGTRTPQGLLHAMVFSEKSKRHETVLGNVRMPLLCALCSGIHKSTIFHKNVTNDLFGSSLRNPNFPGVAVGVRIAFSGLVGFSFSNTSSIFFETSEYGVRKHCGLSKKN
jgi:hypothetical protein